MAALAAVALAGCGRSAPDLVNGKKLFIGKATCGSCHTLQHAGTKGTQGPNLDAAFLNARQKGFGDSVIEGVVRDQIRNPRRGSIMPANLVKVIEPRRGWPIWSRTTPSITLSPKPLLRAFSKAASRFGP